MSTMVAAKERRMGFKGRMVLALLDGSKTQTRRIITLPPMGRLGEWQATTIGGPDGGRTASGKAIPLQGAIWHTRTGMVLTCLHGQPGDRLWVREAWQHSHFRYGPNSEVFYFADYLDGPYGPDGRDRIWRPSIQMPRAASRILLEIVSVRVERLYDISEEDARAEGAAFFEPANSLSHGGWTHDHHYVHKTAKMSYQRLWESINTKGRWEGNPWVWAIEFRRVQ